MDRRAFLKLFGGAVAGAALAPAIPFNRVWSFPSALANLFPWRRFLGFAAAGEIGPLAEFTVDIEAGPSYESSGNQTLTISQITLETMKILEQNMQLCREWNERYAADAFDRLNVVVSKWQREPLAIRVPERYLIEPGDRFSIAGVRSRRSTNRSALTLSPSAASRASLFSAASLRDPSGL